ncbi:MAG: winged helix DNA-binding domain-containing protein, partial [Chloroflexota bacterium]|nr:winged helix DNA-binding domain-containing protein [Chloroflexota bacterium]
MSTPIPTIAISGDVARRFLLGRQGLWPGRRRSGKAGTLAAVRQLGSVQMDPLTIVARSHDLVLWSRVADYRPEMIRHHLYTDRSLFDYGGVLRIQPIEELPHWRLHMERRREDAKYYAPLLRDHLELFDAVRAAVEREGPLSARAISKLVEVSAAPGRTTAKTGTGSYRSQSVVNKMAYQLWMTGELMTHHREGFDRHFDLAERVAPAALLTASDEATARDFFARKIIAQAGLITAGSWRSTLGSHLQRKVDR